MRSKGVHTRRLQETGRLRRELPRRFARTFCANKCLSFAKDLLDAVLSLVGAESVHHDDVAGLKSGREDLLNVNPKALNRAIDDERRLDTLMA